MTKDTTPPPDTTTTKTTTNTTHEPPSHPASPIAKRTKPNTTYDNNKNNDNNMPTPAVTSISQPFPPLFVKKLTDSALAPTRGSAFAAGYDLYSAKETVIPARGKALVDTGIAIAVPEGTCTFPFYPPKSRTIETIRVKEKREVFWLMSVCLCACRRPRRPPQRPRLETLHRYRRRRDRCGLPG